MNVKDKMEMIEKEMFNICDSLFPKIKNYNNRLMNKSNTSYDDGTIDDVIKFSTSSNCLSLIKSYFHQTLNSITSSLIMRNIIEYLALYYMN